MCTVPKERSLGKWQRDRALGCRCGDAAGCYFCCRVRARPGHAWHAQMSDAKGFLGDMGGYKWIREVGQSGERWKQIYRTSYKNGHLGLLVGSNDLAKHFLSFG